jgi:uncharacterized protein
VFLNDLAAGDLRGRWRGLDKLADVRCGILNETGAFVDAKPYPAGAYRNRSALMAEVRADGLDL